MATDIQAILRNLSSCYQFKDKSVIHVGAGGGQFLGYATDARSVVAVDPEISAVERLRAALALLPFRDRFTVVQGEFGTHLGAADVVFFEFCLHEIPEPRNALRDAKLLASDVVVIDHDPESRWAWHTAETDKARNSWAAVHDYSVRLDRQFTGVQRFSDVSELLQKVGCLGEPAISRANLFLNQAPIEIETKYRIAVF
ncbi:MAG: methyltransferase domain-containing protein [Terriglobia bacterium]|nr:methyltransferase domain-containing protein [Terriglobia bacterium]